jgi:hypothetical protein
MSFKAFSHDIIQLDDIRITINLPPYKMGKRPQPSLHAPTDEIAMIRRKDNPRLLSSSHGRLAHIFRTVKNA